MLFAPSVTFYLLEFVGPRVSTNEVLALIPQLQVLHLSARVLQNFSLDWVLARVLQKLLHERLLFIDFSIAEHDWLHVDPIGQRADQVRGHLW